MSKNYKIKKKTVHLEDYLHKELRKTAFKKNTSIEKVVNDILKEKLKPNKKKK